MDDSGSELQPIPSHRDITDTYFTIHLSIANRRSVPVSIRDISLSIETDQELFASRPASFKDYVSSESSTV